MAQVTHLERLGYSVGGTAPEDDLKSLEEGNFHIHHSDCKQFHVFPTVLLSCSIGSNKRAILQSVSAVTGKYTYYDPIVSAIVTAPA